LVDGSPTTTAGRGTSQRTDQRVEQRFRRFVAIGDSTTEGMDDPAPGGGYRGWADRLAARMAELDPRFEYANLAVRGRYAGQVMAEQLAPAVALRPDLVSVIAGVNDLLRPRCDLTEVIGQLDTMCATLVATGATVLTITQPDPVAVARIGRPIRRRLFAYNEGVRACADRHGLLLVDFERIPECTHPMFWSEDRLHLNTLGHIRMAATVAEVLGMPPVPGEPGIGNSGGPDSVLPPAPLLGLREALERDAAWVGQYFAPWVWRHVRGRSAGDGIVAKRPLLGPII
jgi:lysophospholipase L1-like esterase